MECNRCSEQQSQETIDDALVAGTANELFVCLRCQDESNESDLGSSREDGSGPLLSLDEQHMTARLQRGGR